MKRQILFFASTLVAAAAIYAADGKSAPAIDSATAFARLKSLAGEWEANTDMGKARVTYTLIAGGTALVERETSDQMPEMMTVYHFDGKRLLLTHYCAVGNQPRMEATAFDPATGELKFRFLDATNLTSPAAGHMHNASFRFVDDRHLIAEWQFYENGQVKMTETAQYSRVR
jgi:hypothetical protein